MALTETAEQPIDRIVVHSRLNVGTRVSLRCITPADEEHLKAMRPELALSLRLQVPKTRARLVDVVMP